MMMSKHSHMWFKYRANIIFIKYHAFELNILGYHSEKKEHISFFDFNRVKSNYESFYAVILRSSYLSFKPLHTIKC